MPAPVTDPPGCGSITYSIDGGAASAAIKEQADPSAPELTIFYNSSLDLSNPNGDGSLSHPYVVSVTVRDS